MPQIFLGQLLALGESDGKAPNSFLILRGGESPSRKGTLLLDDAAREAILSDFALGGVDVGIDLEHSWAKANVPTAERRAYGWFKPAVLEDGSLVATEVEWTEEGRALVESKAWRYTSLWGEVEPTADKKALRLVRLHSVSLVNKPAVLGNSPLVANEDLSPNEADTMSLQVLYSVFSVASDEAVMSSAQALLTEREGLAKSLSCSVAELPGALAALKLKADKHDELVLAETTRVEADKKAAELKAQNDAAAEKTALIARLSADEKLPPTLHAWAETQSLESLRAFEAGAPKVTPAKIPSNEGGAPAKVTLSAEETEVATKLGITTEEALKAKQRDLASRA